MASTGPRRLGVIAGHFETTSPRGAAAGERALAAALERVLDGDSPARAELRGRMKAHMAADPALYTP